LLKKIQLAAVSGAFVLVAFSAVAFAQARPQDVECKKTETQAECHARLKCKQNEEVEDCQKRLLRCNAGEKMEDCKKRAAAAQQQGNQGQGNQGNQGNQNNQGNQGNQGQQGGRERENEGRERENADRGGGERRGNEQRERGGDEERSSPRRRRGGDDGGGGGGGGGRRRGGGGGGGDGGFEANKTFGLGLELGEPTGLNGKYFLSPSGALDFGVGYIYGYYYYGDGIHIYGDYLWHPVSLVSAQAFELPFYIGVGGRFWDFRYCYQRVCDYGGSALGVRVPVGISFDFNDVPLDIFIQLVPVLDFVNGDYYDRYRDRAHLGIDLSVGIRFWFK
jgi:hypothetical protein